MPETDSLDLDLCLGRQVLRLDCLLPGPEDLHLRGEAPLGLDQLLLLGLQPGNLLVEGGDLGVDGVLPLKGEAREVHPVRPDRFAGLLLQGLAVLEQASPAAAGVAFSTS